MRLINVSDFNCITITNSPASGFSSPIIILKIVDLPAPLGPIIPTIPACGNVKFKLSYNLSPYALATPLASITLVPKRGPLGNINF
jgi:hypothetical protein